MLVKPVPSYTPWRGLFCGVLTFAGGRRVRVWDSFGDKSIVFVAGLRMISTNVDLLESLILAQDERWRRA